MYDEITSYKTLILYRLKDIEIDDIKRVIQEKIFEYDLDDILIQKWYEIDLQELDIERIYIYMRLRNRFILK